MSSKHGTRDISLKGETYDAYKAACQAGPLSTRYQMEALIDEVLDGDLVEENAHWAKFRQDKLEAIKTRSHSYQKKAKAKKAEKPVPLDFVESSEKFLASYEVSQEQRPIDPPQPISPEYVLASFHNRFGMPGPVASILPNEVEPTPQIKPGSVFLIPEKEPEEEDDEEEYIPVRAEDVRPFQVEKLTQVIRHKVTHAPASSGLFSPGELEKAKAASKDGPVTPPAHGRRAVGTISLSDAQSCIDPTRGKK